MITKYVPYSGAVLGSALSGLVVSSTGVLSRTDDLIDVDSDMDSSRTFNISTRLYGDTLQYDTLIPRGGSITNNCT